MRYISINSLVCMSIFFFLIKGLAAIISYKLINVNYGIIAPIGYLFFGVAFVFFLRKVSFSSYAELIFFFIPIVALMLMDSKLFYVSFLFFVTPSFIRYISLGDLSYKLVYALFAIVIIYSSIELIWVYYFNVSTASLNSFLTGAFGKELVYDDSRGIYEFGYRSPGFVFNLLIHPFLLAISTSFYIGCSFFSKKFIDLFLAFLGLALIMLSYSGTAAASVFLVFVFQLVLGVKNGNYLSFVFLFFIILMGIALVSNVDYSTFDRVFNNLDSKEYVSNFSSFDLSWEHLIVIFFTGAWSSSFPGVSSHVDYYKLIFCFGIFMLIYWLIKSEVVKLIYWLVFRNIKTTPMISGCSSAIVAWFGCFAHHQMSLTPIGIFCFVLACASLRRYVYLSHYTVSDSTTRSLVTKKTGVGTVFTTNQG